MGKEKANKHDLTTLLMCMPEVKGRMCTHACIEAFLVDITRNVHHRNDHAMLDRSTTFVAHIYTQSTCSNVQCRLPSVQYEAGCVWTLCTVFTPFGFDVS